MYCPKCNLTVALHDPDRVVRNGQEFHAGCLAKTKRVQQMPLTLSHPVVSRQRQGYFRFAAHQMIH
jgi:hypothetical protein